MRLAVAYLCVLILVAVDARIKRRRKDITNFGHKHMFHGWVDVQAQGVNNDYCRFVGPNGGYLHKWLSCALAGTEGHSEYNYNPPNGGTISFDPGYNGTWYMKDVNQDGRDDYCRCVDGGSNSNAKSYTACMLADRFGFQCDQHGYAIQGCAEHAP